MATSKKNKHTNATSFGKGNVASKGHGRPKLDKEVKEARQSGKLKSITSVYQAFFEPSSNLDEIADNKKLPAIERGFARMALDFIDSPDTKVAELVCGVMGVSTKAKEIDHKVTAGSYIDVLNELKNASDDS